MAEPTLEQLKEDLAALKKDLAARINYLRGMSRKAEEDLQRQIDIGEGVYGGLNVTPAERELIEGEGQEREVLGRPASTTATDVGVILDEIIDELPGGVSPLTDYERNEYRKTIATSILDSSIEADDPMFAGKEADLHSAIAARRREIALFPHHATRALQMQEAIQYIISSRHGGLRFEFERWLETHPDALDRLEDSMPHIMPEADAQARLGRVTGAPKLFRQFEKMDDSDNPAVRRIFFDIVTPPAEREAAEFQLTAERLLLDDNGNLRTAEDIVDKIISERSIRNTKGEMVEPGDWEAFQAWRSNTIENIENVRDPLILDGADTGLVAVHLFQRVQLAIDEMPREMGRHKEEAAAKAPPPDIVAVAEKALKQNGLTKSSITSEDYVSLTDHIELLIGEGRDLNDVRRWVAENKEQLKRNKEFGSVKGIEANDPEVKEVLANFGIFQDQITVESFRDLKRRLADYSRAAGSSQGGADLLDNYLSKFDRARQLLEDKEAEVRGETTQERREALATPQGAAAAIEDFLFQHPEWGLRPEDLTEDRKDWLAQFVRQRGVEGLSRYLDANPTQIKRFHTEKKSQGVVSGGRAGLESLLYQMGYGGVVDGISQIDVILDQWNVPEVLQDIANRTGEDPTAIVMEHLGLKEPARYPRPYPTEPPGFPTEPELDEGRVKPFEPSGIPGTELPDLEVLAAQRDPSVPPFIPIAPERRTPAQTTAFQRMPSMGGVEALPVSMYPTPAVSLPRGFGDTDLGPEMEAMIDRRAGGDRNLVPYLREEARRFLPEFRRGVQDARAARTTALMRSAREAEIDAWETEMAAWNPESSIDKPVIGGWDEEEHGGIALKDMIRGMRATAEAESVEFMPAFEERIATLPPIMEMRKARRLRRKGRPRFV